MRNIRFVAVLLVVVTVLAAGCGSTKKKAASHASGATAGSPEVSATAAMPPSKPAAKGTVLALAVKPGTLTFDKPTMTAKAGTITINLTNPDAVQHNIAIDDPHGVSAASDGKLVSNGGVSTVTFTAHPGKYKYYCSVHEKAGMDGYLTVTA
jgi:plastocyanin